MAAGRPTRSATNRAATSATHATTRWLRVSAATASMSSSLRRSVRPWNALRSRSMRAGLRWSTSRPTTALAPGRCSSPIIQPNSNPALLLWRGRVSDQGGRLWPPFFRAMPPCPLPFARQSARELAKRLLVALVRDLGEVARQFEAHTLARADGARILPFQPIEEIPDRHTQHLRNLIEPTGRNTVDAAFVFVRLLIGHPDQVGQLLLGQAQHD